MNQTGRNVSRFSSAAASASLLSSGMFQGRLQLGTATRFDLVPWDGNKILLNSQVATLPSSGVQRNTTDNLITNTGADAGAAMAASTVYAVYASTGLATFSPNSIRASATLPTRGSDGVLRLGGAGNAAEWIFIGALATDGATQILDNNNTRHIASYYNRLLIRCHIPINWNNNNAETTFTLASATWAHIAGGGTIGAQDVLSILDLGVEDYSVTLDFNVASTAAASWMVGISTAIGFTPSALNPSACWRGGPVTAGVGAGGNCGYWQRANGNIALRLFSASGQSAAAANLVFNADMVRNGAAGDPIGCMFSAGFMG